MDGEACRSAYERFQAHFGNQATRDRIRAMKEGEYQYGFLQDLFKRVSVRRSSRRPTTIW